MHQGLRNMKIIKLENQKNDSFLKQNVFCILGKQKKIKIMWHLI